jgi:hypothetical protein
MNVAVGGLSGAAGGGFSRVLDLGDVLVVAKALFNMRAGVKAYDELTWITALSRRLRVTTTTDQCWPGRLLRHRGKPAHHLIGEAAAGRISCRGLIRGGTAAGVPATPAGLVLTAKSSRPPASATPRQVSPHPASSRWSRMGCSYRSRPGYVPAASKERK